MTRGIQEWGLSKKARCYLFATCLVDWSWLACRQDVLFFFFFLINSFLALLYMPTLTLCACWIGLESVKLVYRPWKSSFNPIQPCRESESICPEKNLLPTSLHHFSHKWHIIDIKRNIYTFTSITIYGLLRVLFKTWKPYQS